MPRRNPTVVIAAFSITIAACGGGTESSTKDDLPTPSSPVITESTNDTASATVAPDTPAPTTSETAEVTAPIETIAVSAEECPNGIWRIDPASIGAFGVLGSSDDFALTAEGDFLATFADGRYTIAADEFSLEVLVSPSVIAMAVTGSTSGALVVGEEMLTFDETSFEMSADVTVDGAEVPGGFIEDIFHETFGSATAPYTCNADGTLTITYDTPTGPATAVYEPA